MATLNVSHLVSYFNKEHCRKSAWGNSAQHHLGSATVQLPREYRGVAGPLFTIVFTVRSSCSSLRSWAWHCCLCARGWFAGLVLFPAFPGASPLLFSPLVKFMVGQYSYYCFWAGRCLHWRFTMISLISGFISVVVQLGTEAQMHSWHKNQTGLAANEMGKSGAWLGSRAVMFFPNRGEWRPNRLQ